MGKSEYGRAFSARSGSGKYIENLRYCHERRRREHLHTPICWDTDSDSENTDDIEAINEKYDELKLGGYENARLLHEENNCVNNDDIDAKSTEIRMLNNEDDIRKCKSDSNISTSSQTHKKVVVTSTKVKEKVPKPESSNTTHQPKGRNKTVPCGRLSAEPPFIPYGCRDERRDVGRKLTHNIRASANIHLSALKAKKRLEIEAKLREEKKTRKRIPKLKGGNITPTESSEWLSEYQLRFPAYDKNVYIQHLPARRVHLLK